VTIYLVRHGHAGSSKHWVGRDELRPLSAKGVAQADGIAVTLADVGLTHLYTSPFTRCVQTMEPLAQKVQLALEPHPALAEGAPVALSLALLHAHLDDTVALCTHGDVLDNVLDALGQQGVTIDGDLETRKGAWWVIDAEGDRLASAHYHPPVQA
jgi:8-oxo-dGTP diphosphatase